MWEEQGISKPASVPLELIKDAQIYPGTHMEVTTPYLIGSAYLEGTRGKEINADPKCFPGGGRI